MKINAAVVLDTNLLSIEPVELAPPAAGEILVQMKAAGVCHSDLHTLRGELETPPPLVLGHEGAGIVAEVGPGVTRIRPGERILVNWLPACGQCSNCLRGHFNMCHRFAATNFAGMLLDGTSRLSLANGTPLKHYLGAATMAQYIVINEESAVPIPDDVSFEVAAIIGCAVATGVGAVVNTGQITPGSTAAVIGCGGVGLSIIQGCQLAGCTPIAAVDVAADKLELARQLGATSLVDVTKVSDVAKQLHEIFDGGPDFVFDSVGSTVTIPQALKAARAGGAAVIVGLHSARSDVPISPADLIFENKRLLGSFVGEINPNRDLPRLIDLYRAGKLQLDALVTQRYPLAKLAEAFAAMEQGALGRTVIVFE